MENAENKLLGSSATFDGIKGIIADYFCTSAENITLTDDGSGKKFTVTNRKNRLSTFRVIKKGKRYRFEKQIIFEFYQK